MAPRCQPLAPRCQPLAPRAPRRPVPDLHSELSVSLAERIAAADSKSPAELAALAVEVKDAMQGLSDVEPEIREMLLRRQRALAAQDEPPPPRTPEPVEAEKPTRVLRHCCCGCGAMLVCGSTEDAAMTELCKTKLLDASEPPPVDASAQRAYCERLAKPRPKKEKKKEEEVAAAPRRARMPDYRYLEEISKPREAPPPPPPEEPFRALPAPSFMKQPKRLSAMSRHSYSEPDLLRPLSPENFSHRASSQAPKLPQLTVAQSAHSKLAELHCHAYKSKVGYPLSPAGRYGLPLLPQLGEDFNGSMSFEEPAQVRKHVSASAQRRYVEKRLYKNPAANGAPGSIADLQARLNSLRKENRETTRKEEYLAQFEDEGKTNRPSHSKHHRRMAAELS